MNHCKCLPAAPLVPFIQRASRETMRAYAQTKSPDRFRVGEGWGQQSTSSLKEVARQIADRFDLNPASVERSLSRIVAGQKWLTPNVADRLAIGLNTHPLLVWGDAWLAIDQTESEGEAA